ncbi:MAG: hypothetical protein ACFE8A_04410 [Candidatus Hodarchaeota archaeon]
MKNIEKLNKFVDKLLKIPGGIYGLLSTCFGSLFVFLSYSNFPGYDMINNDVSVLGIGPGLAAIFFAIGLILIGVFAIPFVIFLGRILQQENENKKLTKRAVKISITSCIALSLIAFFPVINLVMIVIHAMLAVIFFVGECLSLIYFSLIMLRENKFSKMHAYFGFITAGLIIFYIAVRWSIVEWIVFFVLGAWTIEISIYTLYKRLKV